MKKLVLVSLAAFLAFSSGLSAQEHQGENNGDALEENKDHPGEEHQSEDHKSEGHHDFKKHRLAVEFGYTHVPNGYEEVEAESEGEGGGGAVWVPSFGIEYMYRFNHKWAAAVTVSMETGNYLIEYNREDLERENVLIIAAVADYELLPNWSVFAGAGMEIEHHQNFGLVRLGTAYAFRLKKNWDISPTFTFDHKIGYYSYEFVIAIGKSF